MKITNVLLGQASGAHGERMVTICADFEHSDETMTITVKVSSDGTEHDVRELGIARAQDFARHFAETPSQWLSAKKSAHRARA